MQNRLAYTFLLSCCFGFGLPAADFSSAAEVNRDAPDVQIAPDSKLARWHSGQVYFDGQWRTLEEVQQLVTTDPRWQEYRQRVDEAEGSPESHVELAHWCQRNGLAHEEKLQWLYVLQADPNHRGALKGLELIYYQGQLCPLDQVDLHKQQAKAAKQALNHYKPLFLILRRSAKSGSETQREAALAQLAAVSDPAAIPALIQVAKLEYGSVDRPTNQIAAYKKKTFELEIQQTAITALSYIREHEATQKLLEIAILSPYPEIRRAAAEALIPRDKTSYVPRLMAGLAAPLEANIDLNIMPNGVVRLYEQITDVGPESQSTSTRRSKYQTKTYYQRQKKLTTNLRKDRANAIARAQRTQAMVASTNQSRLQWNARYQETLKTVTGQDLGEDPENWWTYWQDYNELDYPELKPDYRYSDIDNYCCYQTAPSCFALGTPVWTQHGPTPIESIQIGDLVLSQDPITGCLDYRPVLQTTVRPPSPSINVTLENETIVATRGHRFWVIGDGWRMAKHLKAGDGLHGASSSSGLNAATEGPEIEAFNLVVGEFHTYFVGNSRLLVHDNGCPRPTTFVAPGVELSPTTLP